MTNEEFNTKLVALSKWLWENELEVRGCGCCGSPSVEDAKKWDRDRCADYFDQYSYYNPEKGIGIPVEPAEPAEPVKLQMNRLWVRSEDV